MQGHGAGPQGVAASPYRGEAWSPKVTANVSDMVGPGGYRFGGYWKLGLPMLVLFGVVAVLLVPVFWSF
jgi:hypothetical protein